jgi:hypothetical protein
MKNTHILVFYFCPPLSMSFEVYPLLRRLSFYVALLMWDIFYKTFDDISSMMPTVQSTAKEHFMFNRIHL